MSLIGSVLVLVGVVFAVFGQSFGYALIGAGAVVMVRQAVTDRRSDR